MAPWGGPYVSVRGDGVALWSTRGKVGNSYLEKKMKSSKKAM